MKTFTWQEVWRKGILPQVTRGQLIALRDALRLDRPPICQEMTTQPPPYGRNESLPCTHACAIGYLGIADGCVTVRQVLRYFASVRDIAEKSLGRFTLNHFLNWFDGQPFSKVKSELLAELEDNLATFGAEL